MARALLFDPAVLLLDEATSSLDTVSERAIQDSVDRAMGGRTTVVIAHRMSTVRDADRTIVLHDGQIVESGNHDELMYNNGHYAALVDQQLGQLGG